jgi:Ran GTPase-activating protein (RanGAP) involved in mRNA processing and transport
MNELELHTLLAGISEGTIHTIDLSNTFITAPQIYMITRALQGNTSVVVLNLSNQSIDIHTARELENMLRNNSTIQEMLLNQCKLGPGGIGHIADGLRYNKGLKKLELINNMPGNVWYPYISDRLEGAISFNTCLEHLNLSENNIDCEAVNALVGARLRNSASALKTIVLLKNSIGENGKKALHSLEKHDVVVVLDEKPGRKFLL